MLDLHPALDVALPAVKRVTDCADFSKTVEPYLPQLFELPQKIFDNFNDWEALQHIYLSTNPLIIALGFALLTTPMVLIVSEVNKNYSQVDRLWSILPVIYNCHYTLWSHASGLPSTRLNHVMAVTVLWGIRLTFNYWRKGGYSVGSEDYRWETVKNYVGPYVMFIFNVLFISLAQNLLLLLITAPTYILLLSSRITGNELSAYDEFFPKAMFAFVLVEFFADQQQWNFYEAREKYRETAKVPQEYGHTREQLDRGFNTSGLWAWSRHPNFAGEQGVWVCLYQWSCCESGTWTNWCFAGAIAYLLLFQASTWLTELLSAKKYPEYALYQERVGKFIPKRVTTSMEPLRVRPRERVEEKIEEKQKPVKAAGKAKRR